jgi:hypothetical protein
MLPIMIFALSSIVRALTQTHKTWIFALPVLIISLNAYYPGAGRGFTTTFRADAVLCLQVALFALWMLIIVGGVRIDGFSTRKIKSPWQSIILQIMLGLALSACIVYGGGISDRELPARLFFGLSIMIWFGFSHIMKYVICPLVVLETKDITAALSDYGGVWRRRKQYWYIRFENDPDEYMVGTIRFWGMRNRVGSIYTYTKCKCMFGMVYIRNVNIFAEHASAPSQWEIAGMRPRAKRWRHIGVASVLFVLIVMTALFAFIFTQGK